MRRTISWAAFLVAGLSLGLLAPARGSATGEAAYLGTYVWEEDWDSFGGFSGLEVAKDGLAFTALSDRISLVSGRFRRDATGVVTAVETDAPEPLLDTEGTPLRGGARIARGLP